MKNSKNKVEEFIRVDHAGERGAVKIYEGQLLALNTLVKDENLIETVLMRHNYGNSVCVTTQLGCNIGCSFCASGLLKKTRDLEIEEIVLQITEIEKLTKERVSHIVVMGIGEPFDNYYNTMKFIDIINHTIDGFIYFNCFIVYFNFFSGFIFFTRLYRFD